MLCDEVGQKEPKQMAGFQVKAEDKDLYSIYKWVDILICPERAIPGVCKEDLDPTSRACGRCVEDYYATSPGNCLSCEGGSVAQFVIILVLATIMCIASYYFVNSPMTKKANPLLSVTVMCGMLLMLFQSMGVLGRFSIEWREPLRTMMSVMSIFAFNLDSVGADCFLGTREELPKFALKVCLPLMIAFIYLIAKILLKWEWHLTFNTTGQVYTAVYITIV